MLFETCYELSEIKNSNEIKTLVKESKPASFYELTWEAENLPSGVYFYQLKAGNYLETKKMILLKWSVVED